MTLIQTSSIPTGTKAMDVLTDLNADVKNVYYLPSSQCFVNEDEDGMLLPFEDKERAEFVKEELEGMGFDGDLELITI